jgi:hypothetical protein
MATTKAVLNLQSDLKQPNVPVLPDDVPNKAYVDSVAGASVAATSAPGGGTIGILTVDEDKGLIVQPGTILEIRASGTEGTDFNVSGELITKIETTEGLEYNGSGAVRAKVDITAGSQYSGGGAIIPRIDGATITLNGSGQLQAAAASPPATSAPGGGTQGIVTADEDKGLLITAGVLEVKLDPSTLQFNGSGELEVIGGGGGGSTGLTSQKVCFTRNITLPGAITPPNQISAGTEIDVLEHPDGVITGQRFEITIPEDYFDGPLEIMAVYQLDAAIAAPNNQVRLTTQAEIVDVDSGLIDAATYPETPLTVVTPDNSTVYVRETLLTISDGDFNRGHTINCYVKRLGGDGADLATANWNVVAYEFRYTTVVDSRVATQTVEFFGNTATGTAPFKTTIGTEIDVLDFPGSVDTDQKFTFIVPDNWDGGSDAQIYLNYVMGGVVATNLRLTTTGEIVDVVSGTIGAIAPGIFDLAPTADTDPHRFVTRNIPAASMTKGSSITMVLERTGTSGADVNADDFRLVSASIAFLVAPIVGFNTVTVTETFLEQPVFDPISVTGVDGDLAYPLFGTTFDALVAMDSTIASGRIDVAFPGRLAGSQTQIASIRANISGVGASPQYHLKVYAEGSGAVPVYDSGLTVAPGAPIELTILAGALSAQPTTQKRYHVVVEAHIDAGESINVSLPYVRQE